MIEAVQEALNVVERAGVPLQLSHHKAEGRANWGKVQTTLGMVDRARERGLDVQLDQYPYPAFMTALSIQTLPRYALNGTGEDLTARLSDPAQRAQIAADMRTAHPDWDDTGPNSPWNNLVIGVCRGRPELQGPRDFRSGARSGRRTLSTMSWTCWPKPEALSARSISPSARRTSPRFCAIPTP